MLYLLPHLWQAHYIKVRQFKVTAKTPPIMPQDISRNCTVCYLHYHSKAQLSSLKLKSGTKLKSDANWFKLETTYQVHQSIKVVATEQKEEIRAEN